MRTKITQGMIAGVTPAHDPYEIRDTLIQGFLLRVQPSGAMTYYLEYRTPGGVRKRFRLGSTAQLTLAQARDLARRKAGEAANGKDLQNEKKAAKQAAAILKMRTLEVFLDEMYQPWFASHLSRTTDTVRKVKIAFTHLLTKSMAEIAPLDIERWRTEQRNRGRRPSTINRQVAALKAVLSKAVEWGFLAHDPLPSKTLKPLKTDDIGHIRYLTPEEECRLREALEAREARIRSERTSANQWRAERGYELLPDLTNIAFVDHLRALVILALNTGMRRGELFKLRWEHVDLRARVLTVTGKTAKSKKTRHIPLNVEAIQVLSDWGSPEAREGLVFPADDGGELDNVQTSWEKVVKSAALVDFRFHDLRHAFASKLVMRGVDLNTVRELLGHSNITMTLRYAHLAPGHMADAVAKLVA